MENGIKNAKNIWKIQTTLNILYNRKKMDYLKICKETKN